jgi:hypothetical protein
LKILHKYYLPNRDGQDGRRRDAETGEKRRQGEKEISGRDDKKMRRGVTTCRLILPIPAVSAI